MSDSAFKVHAMELGPMENFVYLVEDLGSRRCAVVDPAWEVGRIVARAEQIYTEDIVVGSVQPGKVATIYSRSSGLFELFCLFLFVGSALRLYLLLRNSPKEFGLGTDPRQNNLQKQ